jgi:hypothetical protein
LEGGTGPEAAIEAFIPIMQQSSLMPRTPYAAGLTQTGTQA